MRKIAFGVVAALAAAVTSSAADQPKINTGFNVGVSQQGAITNHFLDPSKIYFSVESTEHEVQDVTVTTSLYSTDKSLVATFACHVGDLGKNQRSQYAGVSCDWTPRTPYTSNDDLTADVSVSFTATTSAVTGLPVKKLPNP